MVQNQVSPASGGTSNKSVLRTDDNIPEDARTYLAQGRRRSSNSPKLSPESRAKIWSVFNLLLPLFNIVESSRNFFHSNYHTSHPHHHKENNSTVRPVLSDVHIFCHAGNTGLQRSYWALSVLGLILYVVISVMFLLAAFAVVKSTKNRLLFVKMYWLVCVVPVVLVGPVTIFFTKVGSCTGEKHFWWFDFIPLALVLIPMVIIGAVVAVHFRRWLGDPARADQEGQVVSTIVVVATVVNQEEEDVPDELAEDT